jgi:hypothetical protein
MTLALLAIGAGVMVGYARGGGLARLSTLRPRRNRLLVTAIGLHALGVLAGWLWEPLLPVLVSLSWALLAYYAWMNRPIPGTFLIAVGLAANAAVLLANGAMPVSETAAARAGADQAAILASGEHEPEDSHTRLPWLGKVVPVAFPPRPEVVTPGDVSVAAGIAVLLGMGLTGRREPARPFDPAVEHTALDGVDEYEAADYPGEDVDRERATIDAEAGPQRSAVV